MAFWYFPDFSIFLQSMKQALESLVFAIDDNRYTDVKCIMPPGDQRPGHSAFAAIFARQEMVNERRKQFHVLKTNFVTIFRYISTVFTRFS